ncbi:MAG: division/cell wall cluster transcriptional repressor MraZ [Patescibacteria group bacterium]
MLIGEYIHRLDEKNRVPLPAKFRREMGKNVVITPGLDNCLFVFTTNEWERVSGALTHKNSELSFLRRDLRVFNRNLFGQATEVEIDSIGRILIPNFLKDKIGLKEEAALVGVGDRVEIWSLPSWKKYLDETEKEQSAIAEKLASDE